MLCVTNTTIASGSGGSTFLPGPATITGARLGFFVWSPTARQPEDGTGTVTPVQESTRGATTCYMRGLKEKITLTSNDGCPWLWRRVVFYSRDATLRNANLIAGDTVYRPYFYGTSGYQRVVNQPVIGGPYDDRIWKGTAGQDWSDFLDAVVDTRRVDLVYDKTVSLNPGSQQGFNRSFTRWHPMNKNLVYDDDESGGKEATNYWSVTDKQGMGDCYVVDIFQSGAGRAPNNDSQLYFRPEATLYWHER